MADFRAQLLYWGTQLFHRLPVSFHTRLALRNFLFRHAGFLFKDMASWQAWHTEQHFEEENHTPLEQLQEAREEVFAQWFARSPAPATFLLISHDLGGGTEVHVQALAAALEKEGIRVLILRRCRGERVKLIHPTEEAGQRLIFDIKREYPAFLEMLSRLNIRHIHVHHLIDLPDGAMRLVQEMAAALEVAYDFTAHDYFPICPRFTLYDQAVRGYCGEPAAVSKCNACVSTFGSPAGKAVDVARWREAYGEFLNGARYVFTPSGDTAERLKRYFPEVHFAVRPHRELAGIAEHLAQPQKEGDVLQVLTIGAIAPHKGSHVLLECATDAQKRRLPIHFTIIGHTDIDWKLKRLPNVTITGRYKNHDAMEQELRKGAFHLVFLPAVWPETYNYTLSEALRYGFFPVAFDIGAVAERLKRMGFGLLLPLAHYTQPQTINDALLACTPLPVPDALLQQQATDYASFLRDYYALEEQTL